MLERLKHNFQESCVITIFLGFLPQMLLQDRLGVSFIVHGQKDWHMFPPHILDICGFESPIILNRMAKES